MKYLIATDSFKGTLSARFAAQAITRGVLAANPDNTAIQLPLADGGEGTAEAVTGALGGSIRPAKVTGPFGETVKGYFGVAEPLIVLDTATASGLALARKSGLDPMKASTYGTGRQIVAALDAGYRQILVGLGGSATNDGGIGALSALGARFYGANGEPIDARRGGEALAEIRSIDLSHLDSRLKSTELSLAYDVAIPLTGEGGASLNYSRQKGADADMMQRLEDGMLRYKEAILASCGIDPNETDGAGAAGGLGCGLMLAGGRLVPGASHILDVTRFDEKAARCDVVITGEGKTDRQTESGKLPYTVAKAAKAHGLPVVCLCGTAAPTPALYEAGMDAVFSITSGPMSHTESCRRTAQLLEKTAFNVAKLLACYER